jgi:hypothetical protein
MSELSELQRWVVEHLQSPRALPRNPTVTTEAADRLTGNERLSPVEQLEVYREQFWLRHTSSLVEDFPGVGGILGQADWERLVESYLHAHTPQSWTLRELGRHFPEHVASFEGLPHRELCRDMARLEWAFIELFDAAECAPLDLGKLASLPPNTLETGRLVLAPALRLMSVSFPVADLRMQLLGRRAGGSEAAVAIPESESQWLVLYRGNDRRLYHRPVTPEAFALLGALGHGLSLVTACESALEACPEHAERLQQNVSGWFQEWARRGWLVDILPGPNPS